MILKDKNEIISFFQSKLVARWCFFLDSVLLVELVFYLVSKILIYESSLYLSGIVYV